MSNRDKKLRVLVAEDEALISIMAQETLSEIGCEPLAAIDLGTALTLAQQEQLDCAYLDLNLLGEEVYPVADLLGQRKIPYVIATGYGPERLKAAYQRAPLLLKPFRPFDLVRIVQGLAGRDKSGAKAVG